MDERGQERERRLNLDVVKLVGNDATAELFLFLKRLADEHPGKRYGSALEDETNPSRVTYAARRNDAVVGMADGIDKGDFFELLLFAVDPKYQHSNVAERLLKTVCGAFDEVRLKAYPFGERLDAVGQNTDTQRETRKRALVRYYEKFGFQSDPDTPPSEDDVVPMIWHRQVRPQYFPIGK